MSAVKHHFHANLRTLRLQKGKTQLQLGDDLGIKQRTIASYESGRATPDFNRLINMAGYFGITVDLLIKYKIK